MHDLRIRVFTQFQRLSLDFFTEEKAGVLMSRMTSDIENLQQLIQDGISQFALQGLTMIVITVILFLTNVELAAWTVLLDRAAALRLLALVPPRVGEGLPSQPRPHRLVLADLSESLYGIRVVTANNRQRRNIRNHRHVVGAYRDANNYTGRVNAIYGPATTMIGILGQALLLGIGGEWSSTTSSTLPTSSSSSCTSTASSRRSSCSSSSTRRLQQGRSSIIRLRELLEIAPSVDEVENAETCPPSRGASRSST